MPRGSAVPSATAEPITREALTILHITAPARVGGLERVVRALCLGHHNEGHRVHLLSVLAEEDADDHPFFPPMQATGVTVHTLAIPTRAYIRERAAMRSLCEPVQPDIVHTHGYRSDVVDASVAQGMGIPVVTTVHGFIRGSWRGRLYEWLQRRAYRRFDAVVAVSRPQLDELAAFGVPFDRLHLIPNAWASGGPSSTRSEARERLGIPADEFHVGWVGRLSREKGADVLLEAVARLTDIRLGVSIIGTGREEGALRAQAQSLGVAELIRWHGLVTEAGPLFSAFDAFVLSSRTEGTPIALLEAMDAGVPIVATRVGGVPDVVSPAEALLVGSERPDELAAAIRQVQGDPGAAETRSRAAAERLRTAYAIDPWLDRYEDIYRRVKRAEAHP